MLFSSTTVTLDGGNTSRLGHWFVPHARTPLYTAILRPSALRHVEHAALARQGLVGHPAISTWHASLESKTSLAWTQKHTI